MGFRETCWSALKAIHRILFPTARTELHGSEKPFDGHGIELTYRGRLLGGWADTYAVKSENGVEIISRMYSWVPWFWYPLGLFAFIVRLIQEIPSQGGEAIFWGHVALGLVAWPLGTMWCMGMNVRIAHSQRVHHFRKNTPGYGYETEMGWKHGPNQKRSNSD